MGRHNKATKEKKAKARQEREAQAQSQLKIDTASSNVEAAGNPPAAAGENQVLSGGQTALRSQFQPEFKPESVQGKRSERAQETAVGDETREGMGAERAEIVKERTNGAAQSVKTEAVTLQPSQWEARQRRRIEDTSAASDKGFDAGSSGQFQRGSYEGEDSRTKGRRGLNQEAGRGGGEGNGYWGGEDYDKRIDALGRLLSSVLRHRAVDLRLKIGSDGYVVVNDLLNLRIKTQAGLPLSSHNVVDINEVVKRDNKQRFGLREENGLLLIRANQGHSINTIKSEDLLKPITSREEVPVCVHGTYLQHLNSIKKEGLKSMGRLHIHFATGLAKEGGVISGMRSSCEVVIHLDVQRYLEDGLKLYRSENGVILAEGINGVIPPTYFANIMEIGKKSHKKI